MLGMSGHDAGDPAETPKALDPRRKNKGDRPPLKESAGAASATLEDALLARESGSRDEARAILAAIDKGQGLRMVLRAAAALEAEDAEELSALLPAVAKEQPPWQLPLQIAAAVASGPERAPLMRRAEQRGAPAWALAWVQSLDTDPSTRRAGLVDLLFADPGLARTVAARDLAVANVKPD